MTIFSLMYTYIRRQVTAHTPVYEKSILFKQHLMGQALISIITRKPIKDRVEEKDPRAAETLLIPDRRIKNNKILQATPIKYNIIVDSSGYCLWINPQGVLSDGAPDADSPSAQFNIVIPDADSSTFRLVTLAFQPPKVVAADFSSDPAQLVIVSE